MAIDKGKYVHKIETFLKSNEYRTLNNDPTLPFQKKKVKNFVESTNYFDNQ